MSENGREELTFHIADYVVWSLILASSIGIGIYYACTGGRQRSTEEFLVGNREMNPIPVAMSIAVSFISAVTFLGTTAEAYSNGVMIWLLTIAVTVACIIGGVFFLPVFHRLKLTSVNEVSIDMIKTPKITPLNTPSRFIVELNVRLFSAKMLLL